jgi:hypothetical protein
MFTQNKNKTHQSNTTLFQKKKIYIYIAIFSEIELYLTNVFYIFILCSTLSFTHFDVILLTKAYQLLVMIFGHISVNFSNKSKFTVPISLDNSDQSDLKYFIFVLGLQATWRVHNHFSEVHASHILKIWATDNAFTVYIILNGIYV